MLHKILITKRSNNWILPSIQLHVLFQQVKSQWWSPPESLHNKSPKTETALLVFEEETDWSISATLLHEDPRPARRSLAAGPSPPVSFQDHLLHRCGWGWGWVNSSFAWALRAVSGVWSPSRHMAGWCQWMEFFDLNQEDRREENEP